MASLTALSTSTFAEFVASSKVPVVVDFWAEWCGPCKQIAPVLAEIASEYESELVIAKVNVDDFPELSAQHGVMSIPTMIVFDGGVAVKRLVGARSKMAMLSELAEVRPLSRT